MLPYLRSVSVLNYVPRVLSCFTCQPVLRAHVPCVRALDFLRALCAINFLRACSALVFLRALRAFIFLRAYIYL